jgi:hypoxia up-regulated 1
MAIDLGGSYVKVAVVQAARKPISIAENEMSKRRTPVMVGFANGQRVLGEGAVTMSSREPDKFIEHLRDLIGRRADDPEVKRILKSNFRKYDVVPDEKRGTIRIRIPGNEHLFSIEELMVRHLFLEVFFMSWSMDSALLCISDIYPFHHLNSDVLR